MDANILNSIRNIAVKDAMNNMQINTIIASFGANYSEDIYQNFSGDKTIICGEAVCGSLQNPIFNFCQK